jgi:colanic acid/amylovoran biosynthesis protein
MTDELKQVIPNCFITMMTPYPELDQGAYRSDLTLRCSRRLPLKVASMIIRALCWRGLHQIFRKAPSWLLNKELKAYINSDIVIDLSGDGLTEEYGVKCILAHLVPIVIGEILGKPVFVCAQTIGPLNKTLGICKWVLKKASWVSARERISFDYLMDIGLDSTKLSLTADMAFLTDSVPSQAARKILIDEGVTFDKPLIGFSISRLPGHLNERNDKVSYEQEFAKTLDKVIELGLRPVFISHTTGPGERRDDRKAALQVASLAKSSSEIAVLKGDYSTEEIKGVIGQMDLFAGVRMHSCIGALSLGIPTISIAYGPKAYGIMSLAGQDHWIIDITDLTADKLFSLINELWQNRETVKESIEREMSTTKALALHNVQIVRRLIGNNIS